MSKQGCRIRLDKQGGADISVTLPHVLGGKTSYLLGVPRAGVAGAAKALVEQIGSGIRVLNAKTEEQLTLFGKFGHVKQGIAQAAVPLEETKND